jgi:hypothetical protein
MLAPDGAFEIHDYKTGSNEKKEPSPASVEMKGADPGLTDASLKCIFE